jgi:hypothetical protein
MRRLRRFIHAALCASSLLIFALAVIVWARSFRAWERVTFTTTHTDGVAWSRFVDHCVSWSRGNITFDRFTVERQGGPFSADHWHYARETPARPINVDMNVPTDRVNVGLAGFRIRLNVDDERMSRVRLARIGLPLWVFLPAAVPPVLWWRHRRYRRRADVGFSVKTLSDVDVSHGK